MKPGEVLAIHFPTMKPLDSDKKVSKEASAPAEAPPRRGGEDRLL